MPVKKPIISPFTEREHADSYPVKPPLWALADGNEAKLDIYKKL